MEFCLATKEMVLSLREIWKACFGDPDRYLDLYFEKRFLPCQTMVACEGGRAVSMLAMLPAKAWSDGELYDARYLYAVATHPDYQGKGLSSGVLEAAHRYLAGEGVAFSFLVPASESLFAFYEKRGFETAFWLSSVQVEAMEHDSAQIQLWESSMAEQENARNRIFGAAGPFIQWDSDALRYQDMENRLTGASVLAARWDGGEGYLLCCPGEDGLLVKELAVSPSVQESVLGAAAGYFGLKCAKARIMAPQKGLGQPFGMAYWYDRDAREKTMGAYLSLVLD